MIYYDLCFVAWPEENVKSDMKFFLSVSFVDVCRFMEWVWQGTSDSQSKVKSRNKHSKESSSEVNNNRHHFYG